MRYTELWEGVIVPYVLRTEEVDLEAGMADPEANSFPVIPEGRLDSGISESFASPAIFKAKVSRSVSQDNGMTGSNLLSGRSERENEKDPREK